MWMSATRGPSATTANAYRDRLAQPPNPRHVQWLRDHGYTGPIFSQRHASQLVSRLAAQEGGVSRG